MLTGYKTSRLLICLIFSIITSACTEATRQKLADVGDSLVITGITVDASGSPVKGVNITAELQAHHLASTDQDGRFRIQLARASIRQLTSAMSSRRKTFFLYFEHGERNFFTASEPLSIEEIGDKNLGLVVMAAPSGISGRALRVDTGQLIGPAANAPMSVGPNSAKIANDGGFALTRVPSGRVPLVITAPGTQAYYTEVQLPAGQTLNISEPQIIFAGVGPQGVLIENSTRSLAELVQSGHPTAKHFKIHVDENTRFVRVHHNPAILQDLEKQEIASRLPQFNLQASAPPTIPPPIDRRVSPNDAPWLPVDGNVDYDFPNNGGNILYYQFADFSKSALSKIHQVGVDVDVFADSDGFSAQAAPPFASSRMKLNVDIPVAAVQMRYGEDPATLANLPWSPIAGDFSYDFRPRVDDPMLGGEPILRRLYGQFRDAFGHESGIFESFFELRLFPGLGLVIGDGSGLVTNQIVPIHLNPPPDALFMRYAESQLGLEEAVWLAAAPIAEFRFAAELNTQTGTYSVAGKRQVCYQLKDANGFISQAVCANVEVDLFAPHGAYGFRINGGNPLSTSLLVDLEIAVPPNAAEMRIFENAPDGATTITTTGTASIYTVGGARNTVAERQWLPAVPKAFYTFVTAGTKNLVIQFRTTGGLVSSAYAQPVTILPMEESYRATDFVINGGAPALSPTLSIDILNVPASAVAMMLSTIRPIISSTTTSTGLTETFTDTVDINNLIWEPVRPRAELQLKFKGPKTVYLQFRNADGQLSPVFKRIVEYDPFPNNLIHIQFAQAFPVTNDRHVLLNIIAPPTAADMRFSTSIEQILLEPYQAFQSPYLFRLAELKGKQRVYVQFRATNGDYSAVFSTPEIEYQPFPPPSLNVEFAGDSETTSTRTVPIKIIAPEPAAQMRIATNPSELLLTTWQTYQCDLLFSLPALPGEYKLYAQVRTAGGIESTIFVSTKQIIYDPFPPESISITANDGNASSTDPSISVSITAPSGATQMRLSNAQNSLSNQNYIPLTKQTTLILPSVDGSYRAYLQLRNADGFESRVIQSNEVTLDVP